MKRATSVIGCAAAAACCCLALAAETALPPQMEDLVQVKAKNVGAAYLLPGADFRSYTKVMIDPADVSFHKDWMRTMNTRSGAPRINERDAQEIAAAARGNFAQIWEDEYRKAGYEIATAPGEGVLRLSPAIANLYINAPDVNTPGRSRTYTVDAGEATLVLQARDSDTGATLGVAVDRRRAGNTSWRLTWTTSVSNRADFGALYRNWAQLSVQCLKDLKENSPVPIQEAAAKGALPSSAR
jgi:hypothetical protein